MRHHPVKKWFLGKTSNQLRHHHRHGSYQTIAVVARLAIATVDVPIAAVVSVDVSVDVVDSTVVAVGNGLFLPSPHCWPHTCFAVTWPGPLDDGNVHADLALS